MLRVSIALQLESLAVSNLSVLELKYGARMAAQQAVQVKATPANNRFKDVLAAESQSQRYPQSALGLDEADMVPSSSSVVPSSTAPRRARDIFSSAAIVSTPMTGKVQSTPTRASGLDSSRLQVPNANIGVLPSSPILARKVAPSNASRLAAPSGVARRANPSGGIQSSSGSKGLFETPLKPRSYMTALSPLAGTPTKSAPQVADAIVQNATDTEVLADAGGSKGVSIYQRMGWDDYDDDLGDLV